MDALIEALKTKHPGYVVQDVRFSVSAGIPIPTDLEALDAELARVVRNARMISFEELTQ